MNISEDVFDCIPSNENYFKNINKALSKESNNAKNRLASIYEDAQFIRKIKNTYLGFPLYANLRHK